MPSSIRKGMVVATGPNNTVGIDYQDGSAGPPVPRWLFGGPTSGLHIGATQFDQALVLGWGNRNQPAALVPMTDHPEQLATLLPGEVRLYGPAGQVLFESNASYPFTLNGSTGCQVIADSFGNIYLRGATGALVVIYSNGSIALTPAGGQGVAMSGGLSVTGGLAVSGGLAVTGTLTVNGVTVTVP